MNKVNKIMVVMPDFGLGGTQRVVSILINHWMSQYAVSLVTVSAAENDFYPCPSQIQRVGLGLVSESGNVVNAILANLNRVRRLRRIIKTEQPDVVISFLESTNILSVLASFMLKLRLILCVRADPARQPLKSVWHLLPKLLYRFADQVTANNKEVITWLTRYISEKKVSFIPNPVKIKHVEYDQESKNILAVGRLHDEKGSDLLLEAFYRSKLYLKGWTLTMVGDGPLYESLQQRVQQLKLSHCVVLTGKQVEVDNYYQQAAIFVVASRHEGMPNAMLEAMCYNLPVIVSDALAAPLEYLQAAKNGITFKSENIDSLSDALVHMAEDTNVRLQFQGNSSLALKANQLSSVLDQWQSIIRGAAA